MAVAETLETVERVSNAPITTRPIWWRQPHSAFLAGLVLFNVVADCLAMDFAFVGTGAMMMAFGFWSAQAALLGLWMALGGLNFPARIAIAAAATVAGSFSMAAAESINTDFKDAFLSFALIGGMIVLATHALLLPLRALLGLRIDFSPAYHAIQHRQRMQLRLADCIWFMTACALPFGLLRFGLLTLGGELLPLTAAMGAYAVLGVLPIALFVSATRRGSIAWLLLGAAFLASLATEYLTIGAVLREDPAVLIPFNVGLLAAVGVNVGALRCFFSLKLFSVLADDAEIDASPLDARKINAELAIVVAAWADLPEATRGEIVAMARSRQPRAAQP